MSFFLWERVYLSHLCIPVFNTQWWHMSELVKKNEWVSMFEHWFPKVCLTLSKVLGGMRRAHVNVRKDKACQNRPKHDSEKHANRGIGSWRSGSWQNMEITVEWTCQKSRDYVSIERSIMTSIMEGLRKVFHEARNVWTKRGRWRCPLSCALNSETVHYGLSSVRSGQHFGIW